MAAKQLNIALVGNPNSGKSTLFNLLTGLNQKVGNYPGVTVDKKTGVIDLGLHKEVQILDLPGAYSMYPSSKDERIVVQHVNGGQIIRECIERPGLLQSVPVDSRQKDS